MCIHDIVANRSIPPLDPGADPPIGQTYAGERTVFKMVVLTKRGRCGHELECRSRWIQAVSGSVQKRVGGVRWPSSRALRRQQRPGVACTCEQLTAVGIEHDGCCLARGLLRVISNNR